MSINSLVGKQGVETTSLLEVIEFTTLSCYCNILRRYSMKYEDNKDFLIWLLVGLILALLFT